jgi:protein SCO1
MRSNLSSIVVAAASCAALAACSRADGGTTQAPAAATTSGAEAWGANFFPNIALTTQDGKAVRFFDDLVKDKVVAINFIYTKCADSCPMETARMVEVQKLLGDRLGKDIFFYSISIDPEHDTPEVLKAYAENWHTGPGWTFLTGKEEDITSLRKKLGVYEADLKKKDHNLGLLIGNQKTGRWMKRSPYENPYILATELGSWLHNWKLPSKGDRDYAKAPEVRNITWGEEFFRARCVSCHSVGGGDRADVTTRRVGPDLLNVGKLRDRRWLQRWMMHPDQMLADQDPLAMALFAQYQNIAMPNLRLTEEDVDVVLKYIEQESKGVESRALAAAKSVQPDAAPAPSPPVVALTAATAKALPGALHGYEAIRLRLADDDLKGVQAAAAAFGAAAGQLELGAAQTRLTAYASLVHDAVDLEGARQWFGALSREVVTLLVAHPELQSGWHVFRCPEALGYQKWIQSTAALKNPFWGKRMLTCGSQLLDWSV